MRKTISCDVCAGLGYTDACMNCAGSGFAFGKQCLACGGSGRYLCKTCRGFGVMTNDYTRACPFCDGSGGERRLPHMRRQPVRSSVRHAAVVPGLPRAAAWPPAPVLQRGRRRQWGIWYNS